MTESFRFGLHLIPVAAAFFAVLAGCASKPQPDLTREQFLEMTSKNYSDHSPGQVLDAAREVFELADDSDFSFSYPTPTSMVASRTWFVYGWYYANGVDRWTITVEQDGTARAALERNVVGKRQTDKDYRPVYEMLWGRIEYVLGERDDWPSCTDYGWGDDYSRKILLAGDAGAMETWCGVTVDDHAPALRPVGAPASLFCPIEGVSSPGSITRPSCPS